MAIPFDYLVLEDGSGVDDANTWISSAWADNYHLERDRSAWALKSAEARVAAILLACQWIAATYTFRGTQSDRSRLPMPASGAYDDSSRLISGVPVELQRAQAELAFDHAVSGNPVDAVVTAFEQTLKKVKAGPVEVELGDFVPSEPTRLLIERELSGLILSGSRGDVAVPLEAGFYYWGT